MQRLIVVLGAMTVVACGAGRGDASSADPKPAAASIDTGGELAPVARTTAGPTEARAAATEDLEVRASAPSPVGPVLAGHEGEVPITLTVRNRSEDPLLLDAPHAVVEVFRAGRAVDGCRGEATAIDLPRVLAPGASVSAHATLPCALETPGEYDVVTVVVVGARTPAVSATDTRRSVSTHVTVDPDAARHFGAAMPRARVYPPGHSGLVDPSPSQVRATTPAP